MRFGIDREVAISMLQDVVMVQVTVYQPVNTAADIREEFAGQRHEYAAFLLRVIEPRLHVGANWTKGRCRRFPEPMRNINRNLEGGVFWRRGQVGSRHATLLQQHAPGATQETNGTVTVPYL